MVEPAHPPVKPERARGSPGRGAKMRALSAAMAGDPEKPFVLEGMVTALNVLRVLTDDLGAIDGALELKVAQSPVLFKGAPIIIDVSALELDPGAEPGSASATAQAQLSIAALNALLKRRGLVPVGAYARG